MKMLLLLVLVLVPTFVFAQQGQETYFRPATGQYSSYVMTESTMVSNPMGPQTRVVRIVLSSDGFIAIGASDTFGSTGSPGPLATRATGMHLPGSEPEYFRINPGEYIAVIASAVTGTINVIEMTR
jgi:hypothetical protein